MLESLPPRVAVDSETAALTPARGGWSEDVIAIVIGGAVLLTSLLSTTHQSLVEADGQRSIVASNPLNDWLGKPGGWVTFPDEALGGWGNGLPKSLGIAISGIVIGLLFAVGVAATHVGGKLQAATQFLRGYVGVFVLASLAYLLAGHELIKAANLEYPLWALGISLVIAATVGVPDWLRPAARTEFYIKTGLVLLGSEILISRLLALGLPGVFVAWVVTPVVLISTFWFGQRVLKMSSPTLNMVISADMSVCGVSAAIASAAACRAKKEELSLAIGLSLAFTVIMMVVMPLAIEAIGMDPVLAGAWIGGTIDATGAVAVAGELIGEEALPVAVTIKMIQNILIGVVAFGIAVFWTTVMDRDAERTVGWSEIWKRFPKFILGFIAASVVFSMIYGQTEAGPAVTEAAGDAAKTLRGWLFCLAFVSIGLETDFSQWRDSLRGGKPLLLYLCGQSLNLVLTLAMATLMFQVVFPDAGRAPTKPDAVEMAPVPSEARPAEKAPAS